tara:strand:- start:415 stop:750 length:336 start_codon:yes stop_codon:yes gene_type:complete
MKNCIECNAEFKPKNEHHKFCSKECGVKKWKLSYVSPVVKGERFQKSVIEKWNIGKELTCLECLKKFVKKYVSQKYCSKKCRGIYNKKIIEERDKQTKIDRARMEQIENVG